MQINRFWCLKLRRDGVPVPRWQQSEATWHEGLLQMAEERDSLTGRTMIVAKLLSPGRDMEVVAPLLDAQVILFERERLVIKGMERDVTTRRDTAQAWMLVQGRTHQGGGSLEAH